MTRSASRKYASVGAINNRVDLEQELKIKRIWPISICSPPPNLLVDNLQLKDVVSRSLNYVMSFCKYATLLKTEPKEKNQKRNSEFNFKSVKLVDLSPYLSHEPMTENGDHQTHIMLHLNESVLSHQFINAISINNEEQRQSLVIQEDDNEMETITLHSGETYVLDNKYISNSNAVFVNLSETRASSNIIQSIVHEDPMMAVYNDHTYAMRHSENIYVAESQLSEVQASLKQEKSELIFQNALTDLLLNTTVLKCIICGETPQEMIEILDKAHHNREYF